MLLFSQVLEHDPVQYEATLMMGGSPTILCSVRHPHLLFWLALSIGNKGMRQKTPLKGRK